jgi:hypothetical protein
MCLISQNKYLSPKKKSHLKFDSWKNGKNFQVAPTGVKEQNSANGQNQKHKQPKIADLLELKLNRIKQLDELAVRTTMARRLPPIY